MLSLTMFQYNYTNISSILYPKKNLYRSERLWVIVRPSTMSKPHTAWQTMKCTDITHVKQCKRED